MVVIRMGWKGTCITMSMLAINELKTTMRIYPQQDQVLFWNRSRLECPNDQPSEMNGRSFDIPHLPPHQSEPTLSPDRQVEPDKKSRTRTPSPPRSALPPWSLCLHPHWNSQTTTRNPCSQNQDHCGLAARAHLVIITPTPLVGKMVHRSLEFPDRFILLVKTSLQGVHLLHQV